MSEEEQSDQFNGRLGLIFASIGAAIGTGNIWRFPRMVGANGGGTFLVPWLIFLFAWSIPLVIAEYAMGKRSRTGTIGTFRIFAGKKFAWMGLWTAWISTAIGFYYAVVSGWTIKYFQLGISGALTGEGVDTTEVWNAFLQSPGQVIFFQFLVIVLTLAAIWKGAKAIEKVNFYLMISLFALLFLTLFLSLWMDMEDGSLDGAMFMFTVDFAMLKDPEVWINGLSQSAWSCSAGMGMCITYAVYMSKDEDTVLNAFTMGLANNSISIIAGLAVLSAIFAVSPDPLATVTGGSSAITFLALPEVFAKAPFAPIGPLFMMAGFFLALSFAAMTSMISTVELCVRNFVDHGYNREMSGTVVAPNRLEMVSFAAKASASPDIPRPATSEVRLNPRASATKMEPMNTMANLKMLSTAEMRVRSEPSNSSSLSSKPTTSCTMDTKRKAQTTREIAKINCKAFGMTLVATSGKSMPVLTSSIISIRVLSKNSATPAPAAVPRALSESRMVLV
jgi:NSS family neurotransmitter:Na+ symporter